MSIIIDEFIECFWITLNKIDSNHGLDKYLEENSQKLSDYSREQIHELAIKSYQASSADRFITFYHLHHGSSSGLYNLYNEIFRLMNPSNMLTALDNKLKKLKTKGEQLKTNLKLLKLEEDSISEQIIIQKIKLSMEKEKNKATEYEELKTRQKRLQDELNKLKEQEKAYL